MGTGRHTVVGQEVVRIAMRMGLVDAGQLRTVMRGYDGRDLGAVLVEHGLLSPEQLAVCQKALAFKTFRDADLVLVKTWLDRHDASPEALRAAVAEQKRRFLSSGERVSVVALLQPASSAPHGLDLDDLPDFTPPTGVGAGARLGRRSRGRACGGSLARRADRQRRGTATPAAAEDDAPVLGVEVSEDKMAARLRRRLEVEVTVDEVHAWLSRRRIVHGWASNAEIRTWLQNPAAGELLVAQGDPAVQPVHGAVHCNFEADPLGIGAEREDGTIDFSEKGEVPLVDVDDLLARRTPPMLGKAGRDVFGDVVLPDTVRDSVLRPGKNTRASEDGLEVFATKPGRPCRLPDGRVAVFPQHRIDGDVGVASGHVDFDGSVYVNGEVTANYRVNCGRLVCQGVTRGEVEAVGDVIVDGGIVGARLKVGGNLRARFINDSVIEVVGNVAVHKEVMESRISCSGKVKVGSGSIRSSRVSARQGLSAMDVDAPGGKASELIVGVDEALQAKLKEREAEAQALNDKAEGLAADLATLAEREEGIEAELGDLCQLQDKDHVRLRQLAAELRRAPGSEVEALQNERRAIASRSTHNDETMEELFVQIEAVQSRAASVRDEIATIRAAHAEVGRAIDELNEWAELNDVIAVAQVNGRVAAYTKIRGTRSQLVLDRDLTGVVFEEVRDDDGRLKMRSRARRR